MYEKRIDMHEKVVEHKYELLKIVNDLLEVSFKSGQDTVISKIIDIIENKINDSPYYTLLEIRNLLKEGKF